MKNQCLLLLLLLPALCLAEDAPAPSPDSAATSKTAPSPASASSLQHAILVSVNGRKITRRDLDDMGLLLFTINFPDRPQDEVTEEELDQLSTTALRELIILNLVEDELDKINTDKDEKNNIIIKDNEIMTNVRDLGIEKHLGVPLALRFAKSQLATNQFLAQTGTVFTPTPRIITNFYSAHRPDVFTTERMVQVRHIFLPLDTGEGSVSKKQAQMLYEELRKMDVAKRARMFPEMAKEFSQGRFKESGGLISVSNSGDSWFPQNHPFKMSDGGTFFPEGMLRGIRALAEPGDVQHSKSTAGWHILYLDQVKGGTAVPLASVRKLVEDYLLQESIDRVKINWLDRKSAKSNIIWHDGDPFPREKILLSMDPAQRLQFLRARITRMAENAGAPKPQPARANDIFGGHAPAKP